LPLRPFAQRPYPVTSDFQPTVFIISFWLPRLLAMDSPHGICSMLMHDYWNELPRICNGTHSGTTPCADT